MRVPSGTKFIVPIIVNHNLIPVDLTNFLYQIDLSSFGTIICKFQKSISSAGTGAACVSFNNEIIGVGNPDGVY